MKHLIINNYKTAFLVFIIICCNTFYIQVLSQETNAVGTVTETISPLITLNPDSNTPVLNNDEEINAISIP